MIVNRELSRGVLIAIEGIDGAGKTTQAKTLYQQLKDRGYMVILLHEPTDAFFGKLIKESAINGRHNVKKELEYFIEDRIEDVKINIKPALDNKLIVIMDRYYFSTLAYQGARGMEVDDIRELNESFAPKADLTIILDIAPTIGLSRIRTNRLNEPNHFEREDYLTDVREYFKNIKDSSIQIIDGAREPHEISNEMLNMVLNILKPVERTNIEIKR